MTTIARAPFAVFVIFLTSLTGCQISTSSPDDLSIRVGGGRVSTPLAGSDGQVRAYKGIPYAAPPGLGICDGRPLRPSRAGKASG